MLREGIRQLQLVVSQKTYQSGGRILGVFAPPPNMRCSAYLRICRVHEYAEQIRAHLGKKPLAGFDFLEFRRHVLCIFPNSAYHRKGIVRVVSRLLCWYTLRRPSFHVSYEFIGFSFMRWVDETNCGLCSLKVRVSLFLQVSVDYPSPRARTENPWGKCLACMRAVICLVPYDGWQAVLLVARRRPGRGATRYSGADTPQYPSGEALLSQTLEGLTVCSQPTRYG